MLEFKSSVWKKNPPIDQISIAETENGTEEKQWRSSAYV